MNDRETTAKSRMLGTELQRVRKRAGYKGAELARILGWSHSRLSRLETGTRGASEQHVMAVLACCRVEGKEFDDLLGLCRDIYNRSWLQSHRDPAEERTLVLHETTANRISEYNPLAIPDLLQTMDYAYSRLHHAALSADTMLEARVGARISHQAIFQQVRPPAFVFFISEHTLRFPIGEPRMMNDQLLHLVLMSSQPHCQVRVLPSSIHPFNGPFRLMEYREHLPLIHIQNLTTSLFLEEPDDIAIYRAILDRLSKLALDEEQSRKLLARLANHYDTPDPHVDDHV